MTEKQKLIEQLKHDLNSSDTAVVMSAINKCNEKGDAGIVLPLIHLYASTKIPTIKKEVAEMLSSLKVTGSEKAFMDALNELVLRVHRKDILAFMWNSGVQPTEQLAELVDMAVEGSLEEAIECLTLVENMSGPFGRDQLDESISAVTEFLNEEPPGQKLSLMREFLAVLETATEF